MSEMRYTIEILPNLISTVPRRDVPSLDGTVITGGTEFGIGWTAAASKYDSANNIQMTPHSKSNLELCIVGFDTVGQGSQLSHVRALSPCS